MQPLLLPLLIQIQIQIRILILTQILPLILRVALLDSECQRCRSANAAASYMLVESAHFQTAHQNQLAEPASQPIGWMFSRKASIQTASIIYLSRLSSLVWRPITSIAAWPRYDELVGCKLCANSFESRLRSINKFGDLFELAARAQARY